MGDEVVIEHWELGPGIEGAAVTRGGSNLSGLLKGWELWDLCRWGEDMRKLCENVMMQKMRENVGKCGQHTLFATLPPPAC